MSNEIDNFIKNFEDMFKNITPAQQTQIKNITNNSNVSNDNLIIPKDATPFILTFGLEALNMQIFFNLGWNNDVVSSQNVLSFYKLKSTNQKMYITKIDINSNIQDTTAGTSVGFVFKIYKNGMPNVNSNTLLFSNASVSPIFGSNPTTSLANNDITISLPIDFKRPIIINKNDIFDIRIASLNDLAYYSPDTYTGYFKIFVGGYLSKVE